MLLRLCKTYKLRIVPLKWWNIKCIKWVIDEKSLCGLNKNILQQNRLHIIWASYVEISLRIYFTFLRKNWYQGYIHFVKTHRLRALPTKYIDGSSLVWLHIFLTMWSWSYMTDVKVRSYVIKKHGSLLHIILTMWSWSYITDVR